MFELTNFDAIQIGLASPEKIREWSHGEVKKPETINYRTLKPERDGLFCERIFGPTKDWECHCGRYKRVRYKGVVCDKCGVEVTRAKVRRERMGHIELAAPVSHIWYFKGIPCRMKMLLDMSPRSLEKVLYFAAFVVLDPGTTPLMYKQVLSDKEYRDAQAEYGPKSFRAGMGAEAIKELLQALDLEKLEEELRREIDNSSGQKRSNAIKRLEVVEAFIKSGNKPEWIIMDAVPVLPPELRPMVQLDGGRFATSDLNDLYRRVINRNNRLKRLLELRAPDIIVRNEKRMLQEAVDALIDNGRRGRPVTGPGNRPLKSLSDMLRGKQGRFRQNLLGKRVDYSGRSVIVVGPELKIYQCGVPKEMAVELFRPFIMKKLVEDGSANNIKSAKKMVDKGRTEVWDALDEIIKDHPVMLNRAPTLHRLGIQAFEPVLVEGRALKLHPLNCTAFNADFDGDQMAIHVPLSAEAQAEARLLMLSANNLLRPQDGGPVTVPTQDMVLGSYYLTFERFENGCCQMTNDEYWPEGVDFALAGKTYDELTEEEKASVHMNIYRDEDEALMAYNEHIIGIHQPIWVRVTKELNGVKVSHVVRATAGRIIFNRNIPQDLGFVKRLNEDGTPSDKFFDYEITETCGKKLLGKIVDKTIKQYGFTIAAEVLDNIKATGYKYSTRGSITISIADMTVPKAKYELIDETEKRVVEIEDQYNMGFITDEERYKLVVREWEKTTADVTDALTANMNKYNPIFMMADSGARGSMKQIRQLTGMRGLMANTAGKTIEIPIKANFREGLSVLEYFTSSRGARKGLADTALRTADSGYLTRRMVDVCQDVIIREADCGAAKGILVSEISEGGQVIEKFSERIKGRFPVRDILKPGTDEVLISKDHMMTEDDAALMESFDIHSAEIRTVLTCRAHSGICAKCYGMNLATSKPVGPGEAVGIIAAQSIGEPGTQLTMRTFHTGGVAGGDITQGLPRVEELFEARKPKKMATIAEIGGKVRFEEATKGSLLNIIITADDGDTRTYAVPHTGLLVQDGEVIEKGRQLQDGALNPHDVLRIRGASAVHNYLIQEVLKVYRQQGVDINDKHIEVIVRQMMRKVRVEDANDAEGLLSGAMADVMEVEDANAAVRARIAAGEKREDGEELQEATYTQLLMGITKASLATDSFLSAASFQETTKVLTEAAIKGKVDHLVGLKENVIIGKLIPAGAGLTAYRQLAEEMVPETEAEKKDEAEAMHTEVPTPVEAPADMDEAKLPESDGPETDTGDAL